GTFDAFWNEFAQNAQVLQRGDASRSNDWLARLSCDLPQQFNVRSSQGAILGHVGHDVAGTAGIFKACQHVPEVAAVLGPAVAGQSGAANVHAHRDLVAVACNGLLGPFRVFQCCGTEVDSGCAEFKCPIQRSIVADAAGELDLDVQFLGDALDNVHVAATVKGRVQVNQMQPFCSGVLPRKRRFQRIAVSGFRTGFALNQAYCLAASDIYSRQKLENWLLAHDVLCEEVMNLVGQGPGGDEAQACKHPQ